MDFDCNIKFIVLLPWLFSILRCEKFAQILEKVMESMLEKQTFPNLFVENTN